MGKNLKGEMNMNGIVKSVERAAVQALVNHYYDSAANPAARADTLRKLADVIPFYFKDVSAEQIDHLKQSIGDPNSRLMQFLGAFLDDADPAYAKKMIMALGFEAALLGTKTIRKNREKYKCNIPWLILFDPTMACNMHCIGCWSGTYGHKSSLTFEEMDRIVTQGKELGVHLYMLTGGEPMVKKNEIFELCRKHKRLRAFAAYTNSTLITEDVCRQVKELGNLTFMVSIEGTPETNDARRGEGHYDAVMKAMDLLKAHGIIFGTSICYTRDNIEAVTSDEFLRLIASKGAHFGFYFHYMPVGNNAVPELHAYNLDACAMIDRNPLHPLIRLRHPVLSDGLPGMTASTWACALQPGRNYFHINSNGDAEPCVFIHFSKRKFMKAIKYSLIYLISYHP